MKRRTFIATLPAIMLASQAFAADDSGPKAVAKALANGETVLVDFTTEWCSTCAAQERVIKKLRAGNSAYDEKITFVHVDWDKHAKSKLAKDLKIPRRSTLVLLKGDQELGRIVAQTSPRTIQELLDLGV